MSALLLVLYIVKEIDRSLFFSYSYLKESKSKSVNISPNVPFLFLILMHPIHSPTYI